MRQRVTARKKIAIGTTVMGIIALTGAIVMWRFGADANAVPAPETMVRPVKTVQLSAMSTTETRSFPGLVRAASETELAFRVGGPLIEFNVRIGEKVEAGQVIARIDPRDFELNVLRLTASIEEVRANLKAMQTGARAEDIASLEADLNAARAQLDNAAHTFKRYENLIEHQAVSQAKLDLARTEYATAGSRVNAVQQALKKAKKGARQEEIDAAQARIKRLEADLKAATHALADTWLKAPFSGYINRKLVDNYENVKSGDHIASLLDFSSVEVRSAIPEDLVIRQSAFAAIQCSLDAYPGRIFDVTVKEIGRKTESANQSYPLTVMLHIPDDLPIQPGMAATLTITLNRSGSIAGGHVLPAGAVFADAKGRECVWIIDPQTMSVVKTPVETSTPTGNMVSVLSGLEAGDRVVTAGARFLRNGQKVRILNSKQEPQS